MQLHAALADVHGTRDVAALLWLAAHCLADTRGRSPPSAFDMDWIPSYLRAIVLCLSVKR
jgi:hypothetical protein